MSPTRTPKTSNRAWVFFALCFLALSLLSQSVQCVGDGKKPPSNTKPKPPKTGAPSPQPPASKPSPQPSSRSILSPQASTSQESLHFPESLIDPGDVPVHHIDPRHAPEQKLPYLPSTLGPSGVKPGHKLLVRPLPLRIIFPPELTILRRLKVILESSQFKNITPDLQPRIMEPLNVLIALISCHVDSQEAPAHLPPYRPIPLSPRYPPPIGSPQQQIESLPHNIGPRHTPEQKLPPPPPTLGPSGVEPGHKPSRIPGDVPPKSSPESVILRSLTNILYSYQLKRVSPVLRSHITGILRVTITLLSDHIGPQESPPPPKPSLLWIIGGRPRSPPDSIGSLESK